MLSNLLSAVINTGGLVALIIALPVVLVLGAFVAVYMYKRTTEKKVGDSKSEAIRILEDARIEAKTLRKEALLEAKEEQLRLRNEFEKETKQRRGEIRKNKKTA